MVGWLVGWFLWYINPCIYIMTHSLIAQETGVQSQVESYQRLKKWYLIPTCLTLSIIKYVSRVKLRNPRKRVASSLKPWWSSYWKGSLQVALDYGRQLYIYFTWHIVGTLTGTATLGQSRSGVMTMNGYSTFPEFSGQSLTIRWFNVISRTIIRGGMSCFSAVMQLMHSTAPADWAFLSWISLI